MSEVTKKAMVFALKELLKTKPFDKITVSDITNQCGMNRMTFYYHFQDMYGLLEYAIISEFSKTLSGNKTVSTWQQGLANILLTSYNNKSFIINAYHSLGRETVERYLSDVVFSLTYSVVDEESKGMSVSEEDKKFIAEFYKYALIGLVLDWVKNNMNEDYTLLLKRFETILNGETKTALTRFAVNK